MLTFPTQIQALEGLRTRVLSLLNTPPRLSGLPQIAEPLESQFLYLHSENEADRPCGFPCIV